MVSSHSPCISAVSLFGLPAGRDSISGVPDGMGGMLPAIKPGGGGRIQSPDPFSPSSPAQPPPLSLQVSLKYTSIYMMSLYLPAAQHITSDPNDPYWGPISPLFLSHSTSVHCPVSQNQQICKASRPSMINVLYIYCCS